jgi:glycerol-3-phosphate acyltransferase PlsY
VLDAVTALAATYLVASVPFGLVLTTLYGGDLDIRTAGSGNIGGTNVARLYGWRLAALVIGLDVAKGFGPVLASTWLWPDAGMAWHGAVLLTAFLAHCFPVWLEFHGGKGVATGAGGLLALTPVAALPAVAVWGVVLGGTGRSSLAALAATGAVVALAAAFDPAALPVVGALALGIVATHVPNLRRLVRGEEAAVVRPVRWGRAATADPGRPTAEQALREGPAGRPAAIWREKVSDPLEPTVPPDE